MKVPVGEPDFPIASVLRGKAVIVGTNQTYKVDHDFSKFSLIPDAILIHDIPTIEDSENFHEKDDTDEDDQQSQSKTAMGRRYRGQVFHGVKTSIASLSYSCSWASIYLRRWWRSQHNLLTSPNVIGCYVSDIRPRQTD